MEQSQNSTDQGGGSEAPAAGPGIPASPAEMAASMLTSLLPPDAANGVLLGEGYKKFGQVPFGTLSRDAAVLVAFLHGLAIGGASSATKAIPEGVGALPLRK